MAGIRKLAQFRQLSLNCETPPPTNRRRTLKKQYSQDAQDEPWVNTNQHVKISLDANKGSRKVDRPPPLRVAWGERSEVADEAVIVKKCKEVRRPPTAKLVRHSSLEKDSILHSKHELAERLKQNNANVAKEKEETTNNKPNLKIFLAHPIRDDESQISDQQYEPKFIQPLTINDKFQIKKAKPKSQTPSPREKALTRSNTIVVVPTIETPKDEAVPNNEEMKAINNIIIRPVTASSRREQFQKRTNSAFHSTVRDTPPTSNRPPLVRSSSAPSNKEKGKFLATKRKLKAKRTHIKSVNIEDEDSENSNKENPKTQKELNRTTAVIGAEVVTMVSLVSPSGSENDEETSDDEKERSNNVKNLPEKNIAKPNNKEENEALPKNLSLRKTVKSVSFQQSSIHAVRSFSASFPARRASVAAAMLLADGRPANGGEARAHGGKAAHARRAAAPDDGERVPKRRLVRSGTVDCGGRQAGHRSGSNLLTQRSEEGPDPDHSSTGNISVNIKAKSVPEFSEGEITLSGPKNPPEKPETPPDKPLDDGQSKCETPKEKQCWELYCKMTEKGINVSYDTILRGMLTPTEYRMRRKNLALDEMGTSVEIDAQENNDNNPTS